MAAKTTAKTTQPKPEQQAGKSNIYLVCGSDDYLVHSRAQQIIDAVADKAAGDFGLETIDGRVDNASQAVSALKQVDEALNTLAFFGGGKTVWLKNANFLGASRTGEARDVVEQLEALGALLKRGLAPGFTFVISATEIDKRRSFYKTLEKSGQIATVGGSHQWGKDETHQVEAFALAQVKAHGKEIEHDALQALIALTGGNYGALASELDKLATYIGDRKEITRPDVAAVGSASAESIVWDLSDAIGARDLKKALQVLSRLLFQGEKDIGILFALIGRVRSLLLLREMIDRKVLRVPNNYPSFKASFDGALARDAGSLSTDRRFNPLLQHPFAVYKSAQQAEKFTFDELRRAMGLLLDANKRIVSSSLDGRIILEQTLISLIGTADENAAKEENEDVQAGVR